MPCWFGTLRQLNCSCGKQTCTWAAMAPKPQQSCLTGVLSLAAGLLWNRLLSWILLLLGFLWICQCMVPALVWLGLLVFFVTVSVIPMCWSFSMGMFSPRPSAAPQGCMHPNPP